MKVFKYDDSEFSFLLPDNWVLEREQNLLSVYDPHQGVGALQFSVYYVDESKNISLKSELIEFLAERHLHFDVKINGEIAYCFLTESEAYWKYWLFKKYNIIVFATYNCALSDVEQESEVVNNIIQSAIQ